MPGTPTKYVSHSPGADPSGAESKVLSSVKKKKKLADEDDERREHNWMGPLLFSTSCQHHPEPDLQPTMRQMLLSGLGDLFMFSW